MVKKTREITYIGMKSSTLILLLKQPCDCGCSDFKIIGINEYEPGDTEYYWQDYNSAILRKKCSKCNSVYTIHEYYTCAMPETEYSLVKYNNPYSEFANGI